MKKFWLAALSVFFVDQLTKYFIRASIPLGSSVPLLPFLGLTHISNTGVSFGFFQGVSGVWTLVALLIVGYIFYNYKELATTNAAAYALGAIIGGAFGNIVDRLLFGAVTDFIDFKIWPTFNVADTAITVSALVLAYQIWKEK